jgi:cytidyltransferase-like protein
MKKVMVFGTFDILHPGHIHLLKEAKEYGDFLIVVIARDATVESVKRHKPAHDEITRRAQITALKIADKVRLGNLDNKHDVLREEKPDIVALGYDQQYFIDDLEEALEDHVQIVRLTAFNPDKYKSSKLRPEIGSQ